MKTIVMTMSENEFLAVLDAVSSQAQDARELADLEVERGEDEAGVWTRKADALAAVEDRMTEILVRRRAREKENEMKTITDTQIEQLKTEAGAHGDLDQVSMCERALEGDEAARAECAEVVAAALAMED